MSMTYFNQHAWIAISGISEGHEYVHLVFLVERAPLVNPQTNDRIFFEFKHAPCSYNDRGRLVADIHLDRVAK